MATANLDRYDLGLPGELDANIRENLSDVLNVISPTEVPFQDAIDMPSTSGAQIDWTRTELNDVDASNARVDGADAGADTSKVSDRLRNYTQISDKPVRVSDAANEENAAAQINTLARQLVLRGLDLRRDCEAILTGNQASAVGDSSTAATTGSLAAWIETNADRDATTGADGGYNTGTGNVDAATDSSAVRALSQATLNTIITGAWTEGGMPDMLMVHPSVKTKISDFLIASSDAKVGVTQSNIDGDGVTPSVVATQSVSIYAHDFGTLNIVPNRFQRDRDVFVLDTSMWDCAIYRDYRVNKLAKTGDATNRQILKQYGLWSWNEKASGVIADVDSSLAMVA